MNSENNRRTFLSAFLLAGGSAVAFNESYRQVQASQSVAARDPLFEHIQQRLATTIRSARTRGGVLTAEDAAAGASYMRICAAHARGLEIDNAARDALERWLAGVSRGVVAGAAPDLTGLRARLGRKGLALSERIARELSMADSDTRSAAVDAIQGGRTTLVCDRLAEALEAAAPRLADAQRSIRPVVAIDQWWCSFYISQWSMYLALAYTLAQFRDPELQEFVDAAWAGFVFYDDLYVSQCERETERERI
jgi:hypothetical protein